MIEYDRLMRDNLVRVFSERDAGRRNEAIRALYAEDAVLYEPEAAVRGHAAIGDAVERLLGGLPPDFTFAASGPALGHHGAGRLYWSGGPADVPPAVSGVDLALFQDGRISALYVFIDPPAGAAA